MTTDNKGTENTGFTASHCTKYAVYRPLDRKVLETEGLHFIRIEGHATKSNGSLVAQVTIPGMAMTQDADILNKDIWTFVSIVDAEERSALKKLQNNKTLMVGLELSNVNR